MALLDLLRRVRARFTRRKQAGSTPASPLASPSSSGERPSTGLALMKMERAFTREGPHGGDQPRLAPSPSPPESPALPYPLPASVLPAGSPESVLPTMHNPFLTPTHPPTPSDSITAFGSLSSPDARSAVPSMTVGPDPSPASPLETSAVVRCAPPSPALPAMVDLANTEPHVTALPAATEPHAPPPPSAPSSPPSRTPPPDLSAPSTSLAIPPHALVARSSPIIFTSLPPPAYVRTHGTHRGMDPDEVANWEEPEQAAFVKEIEWEGQLMMVKFGPRVSRVEAEVMRMVREKTTIPVSEVYAVEEDEGEVFIYQERMQGVPLRYPKWEYATPVQRSSIIDDLRAVISQLRLFAAPAGVPLGLIGGAERARHLSRPLHAWELTWDEVNPVITSVPSLVNWLEGLRPRCRYGGPFAGNELFPLDAPVVLTHCDLHGCNILVEDGRVTAVLDWELASWLPAWAEEFTLGVWARCYGWRGMREIAAGVYGSQELLSRWIGVQFSQA